MVKILVTSQDIRCHYRAMETLSLLEQRIDGNGMDSGHVRVYQDDTEQSSIGWTQLGEDIDGENSDDNSGYSVSLSSDGTHCRYWSKSNDGTWDKFRSCSRL